MKTVFLNLFRDKALRWNLLKFFIFWAIYENFNFRSLRIYPSRISVRTVRQKFWLRKKYIYLRQCCLKVFDIQLINDFPKYHSISSPKSLPYEFTILGNNESVGIGIKFIPFKVFSNDINFSGSKKFLLHWIGN